MERDQLTRVFVERVKANQHCHHVTTGQELHDEVEIGGVL